jgi:hypothetical protein
MLRVVQIGAQLLLGVAKAQIPLLPARMWKLQLHP